MPDATTPNAPIALSAEERDPETVAPGEEFDALVESMIGALQLQGWDADRAREWPFISLPDYANDMANRLRRVEEEDASLTAALLAARREVEYIASMLKADAAARDEDAQVRIDYVSADPRRVEMPDEGFYVREWGAVPLDDDGERDYTGRFYRTTRYATLSEAITAALAATQEGK